MPAARKAAGRKRGSVTRSRTISLANTSSPSTPQPKPCASHTIAPIGTNSATRGQYRPSRPSLSHSPNATSASAIDNAKLTKPNWNGKP